MQKLQVSFYGGIEMKISSERVKHYCSLLIHWFSVNLVLVPKPCQKDSDVAWEQDHTLHNNIVRNPVNKLSK